MRLFFFFFFQAEDGIRDAQESRGLGDVYKRQEVHRAAGLRRASLGAEQGPGQAAQPGRAQRGRRDRGGLVAQPVVDLSLIHISEPTRLLSISYAVFCLKKKKK